MSAILRAKDMNMDPMEKLYYDRQANRKKSYDSKKHKKKDKEKISDKRRRMEEMSEQFYKDMLKSYK